MDNLINIFIKNSEKDFYLRELARILGKSPTTISNKLKSYVSKNILITERRSNHQYFRANIDNIFFKVKKLNYNLKSFYESGIIEFIENELNLPKAIILFGSYAKAENTEKSDIDLLVISSSKKDINLSKFEKKLGHKIQLFIHKKAEIDKLMNLNKELVNNWINGIVVYGYWELLK